MQKRDALDSDPTRHEPGAPATPRGGGAATADASVSEPALPESSTRLARESEPGQPSAGPDDTLLSAGKPAARLELMLEDGLSVVDERLRELDARVSTLERGHSSAAPEPRQKPWLSWLWIAFLIAIVVVFQLLHRVR